MFNEITQSEFDCFRELIYKVAGISMSAQKNSLVAGRLAKRLRHYNLSSYDQYYKLITRDDMRDEFQVMINLLTTNETYFFREDRHFDYLRDTILPEDKSCVFRVWSAAASSGEEAYTTAMVLAEHRGASNSWQIHGTDINLEVLARASKGIYPIAATEKIPSSYLKKYCLEGVRTQAGYFMINKALRSRVEFSQLNLNTDKAWSGVEKYNLILLRNVMIYFDQETKSRLVQRISNHLLPGGYFMIGHSESLNGLNHHLKMIAPSIYRKL